MYNTRPLALSLYAKGVISGSVRDEVFLPTSTPEMQANALLRAVEAKVKVNPKEFTTFVSTLRECEEPSFADRLMQAKGMYHALLFCVCVCVCVWGGGGGGGGGGNEHQQLDVTSFRKLLRTH